MRLPLPLLVLSVLLPTASSGAVFTAKDSETGQLLPILEIIQTDSGITVRASRDQLSDASREVYMIAPVLAHNDTVYDDRSIDGEILYKNNQVIRDYDFSKSEGWIESDNYGRLNVSQYPFIQSSYLGTVYSADISTEEWSFYSPERGWFRSRASDYPQLWDLGENMWKTADGTVGEWFPEANAESLGVDPSAIYEMRDLILNYIQERRIPGGELLVIKDKFKIYHETFGLRNVESNLPWLKNQICAIASMTKPFVGTAAMILVEDGRLKLDDRVADYIPAFNHGEAALITIDQILTHSSGIASDYTVYATLELTVDRIGLNAPFHSPGTEYLYSGAGLATMSRIIEIVTEMPPEDFIQQRIIEPLGLNDTYTNVPQLNEAQQRMGSIYQFTEIANNIHLIYTSTNRPPHPFFIGSGDMYSTVTDYSRFLSMLMNEGITNGVRILKPESVRKLLQPTGVKYDYGHLVRLYRPEDSSEGMLYRFGHAGAFSTLAWCHPESNMIFVFHSQSWQAGVGGSIREIALDFYQ